MLFSKDCLQKPLVSTFLLNVLMCDTSNFAFFYLGANPSQTQEPYVEESCTGHWIQVSSSVAFRATALGRCGLPDFVAVVCSRPWKPSHPEPQGCSPVMSFPELGNLGDQVPQQPFRPDAEQLTRSLPSFCWNAIRYIFFAKSAHSDNVICSFDLLC